MTVIQSPVIETLVFPAIATLTGILIIGFPVAAGKADDQSQGDIYLTFWLLNVVLAAILLVLTPGHILYILAGIGIALPWPTIITKLATALKITTRTTTNATSTAVKCALTWW